MLSASKIGRAFDKLKEHAIAQLPVIRLRFLVEKMFTNQSVSVKYISNVQEYMNQLTQLLSDLPMPVDDADADEVINWLQENVAEKHRCTDTKSSHIGKILGF